jgi:hypothetical protein
VTVSDLGKTPAPLRLPVSAVAKHHEKQAASQNGSSGK